MIVGRKLCTTGLIGRAVSGRFVGPGDGGAAFDPLALSGLVAAFDRSRLDTMYLTSAGVTNIASASDPVGLAFDLSQGLAEGSELVTNGTFESGTTTGWTPSVATLSVFDGQLSVVPDDAFFRRAWQSFSVVAGRWYKISFDYDQDTSTAFGYFVGTALGAGDIIGATYFSGSGTVTRHFKATTATVFINFGAQNSAGQRVLFDNITVKEIEGNHATQSTAAARPLYQTSPSRLVFDGVDDAQVISFATAPGSDCTVCRADPSTGASILTGQTIGTSYTITASDAGLYIYNRALTAGETASMEAFLDALTGGGPL